VQDQALKTFSQLEDSLKIELKQALEKSGPAGAIAVCKKISTELEESLSTESLKIRRISDRPRNPDHMADAYEKKVLDEWRALIAENKQPELHMGDDGKSMRVMKPIRMAAVCLNCHGPARDFPEQLRSALKDNYPQDQATGYNLNELRGAFSATFSD
jgi:hypothetical protein